MVPLTHAPNKLYGRRKEGGLIKRGYISVLG